MYHYLIRENGTIALRAHGAAPTPSKDQVVVSTEACYSPASAWRYDFETKTFTGRTRAAKSARTRLVKGVSEEEAVRRQEARDGLRVLLRDHPELHALVTYMTALGAADISVVLSETVAPAAGDEGP